MTARNPAAMGRAEDVPVATKDEIRGRIGTEVGVSDWLTIGQDRIDAFADATEDRQFIHVDADAAAGTPFGGTVAHGFLSLSMLSRMGCVACASTLGARLFQNMLVPV